MNGGNGLEEIKDENNSNDDDEKSDEFVFYADSLTEEQLQQALRIFSNDFTSVTSLFTATDCDQFSKFKAQNKVNNFGNLDSNLRGQLFEGS